VGAGQGRAVLHQSPSQAYRAELVVQNLAASTISLRLAPIGKLAREMADSGMLDSHTAAAIKRVPRVQQLGKRAGNWLTKNQANDLLNAPKPNTLAGKRNRAILALLLGCRLRIAELLSPNVKDLQQRESR
jgi:site-specific recombinase XerD